MSFGDHLPGRARLLLVGKYVANEASRHARWIDAIRRTRATGGKVWIDYTDNHAVADTESGQFYREALRAADGAICPSLKLQCELKKCWDGPTEIIEDANDLPTLPPKDAASSPRVLMWFGAPINLPYLASALAIFPERVPLRLIIVTSTTGIRLFSQNVFSVPGNMQIQFCPWSVENMVYTARLADACLIPSDRTDPAKHGASSNRLIGALSLGLPVAADMLDSYREFADYFVDLRSGRFHDLVADPLKYRDMVVRAQQRIVPGFGMDAIGRKWARIFNRALEETP